MRADLTEQTLMVARTSISKRRDAERKTLQRLIDNGCAWNNAVGRRRATIGILTTALNEIEETLFGSPDSSFDDHRDLAGTDDVEPDGFDSALWSGMSR